MSLAGPHRREQCVAVFERTHPWSESSQAEHHRPGSKPSNTKKHTLELNIGAGVWDSQQDPHSLNPASESAARDGLGRRRVGPTHVTSRQAVRRTLFVETTCWDQEAHFATWTTGERPHSAHALPLTPSTSAHELPLTPSPAPGVDEGVDASTLVSLPVRPVRDARWCTDRN